MPIEKDGTVQGQLNPLIWHEVHLEKDSAGFTIPPDGVLGFFKGVGSARPDSDSMLAHYKEIADLLNPIFFTPHHPIINVKILGPLRSSAANFTVGNYVASVALSGMVAEILTVLWFQISDIRVGPDQMDKKAQIELFGQTFDWCNQSRRLKILRRLGIINQDIFDSLEWIREKRNNYVHGFNEPWDDVKNESLGTLSRLCKCIREFLEIRHVNGAVHIRQRLLDYLDGRLPASANQQSQTPSSSPAV